MQPKKILLLSVSAGSGHKRAAEALQAYAGQLAELEVLHIDVMQLVTAAFRKIYTDFYLRLVSRAPNLWGYLYRASNDVDADSKLQRLRRQIERLNALPFEKAIRDFSPDAIICTHFLPAEILSRLRRKKRLSCPVWVQVTDFDLHRMWVQPDMQGYFAASPEIVDRMQAEGIPAERIHLSGIPVMPGFASPPPADRMMAELQLDPAVPVVLLMGGGAGIGDLLSASQTLLRIEHDFQLLVLCGKNQQAMSQLQQMAVPAGKQLRVFGFTDQVERLMVCADLVISKPGGLTSAECLALARPMLLSAPIPGQEERNADYLLEQGVAVKACDQISLSYKLRQLLGNPERLAAMRRRAALLSRPAAAAEVLRIVCEHI